MRIPFIARVPDADDLGVEPERFRFITESRGGSAFLAAGASFWLVGAVWCLTWPEARVEWVLYGGASVPVVGWLIGRLQGVRFRRLHVGYAGLAGMAVMTELSALPVMFYLRDESPEALPAVLMIADGAHLLILMWLHLDYGYFLAANAKVVLGILFLFGVVANDYPVQMAASGVVSLCVVPLVWRDSRRTRELYVRPAAG